MPLNDFVALLNSAPLAFFVVAITAEEIVWVLKAKWDDFKKGTEGATKQSAKTERSIVSNFKGIAAAAKAFIGLAAVRYIGQGIAKLGEMADKSRVVRTSMDRLSRGVGQNTQAILTAMRRGVGGAVSELDLMLKANQAILLGLPVTADGMEKLSRVAQRLGRAMGVDLGYALESLVTGIGRQSKLWLDNLGLLVDVESANAKMAKSLGKTTEQLTDAEKKLAFYNETMEVAEKKATELGDVAPSIGEKWAKLTALLADRAAIFGNILTPAISAAIDRLAKLVEVAGKVPEALARLGGGPVSPSQMIEDPASRTQARQRELAMQIRPQIKALQDAQAEAERLAQTRGKTFADDYIENVVDPIRERIQFLTESTMILEDALERFSRAGKSAFGFRVTDLETLRPKGLIQPTARPGGTLPETPLSAEALRETRERVALEGLEDLEEKIDKELSEEIAKDFEDLQKKVQRPLKAIGDQLAIQVERGAKKGATAATLALGSIQQGVSALGLGNTALGRGFGGVGQVAGGLMGIQAIKTAGISGLTGGLAMAGQYGMIAAGALTIGKSLVSGIKSFFGGGGGPSRPRQYVPEPVDTVAGLKSYDAKQSYIENRIATLRNAEYPTEAAENLAMEEVIALEADLAKVKKDRKSFLAANTVSSSGGAAFGAANQITSSQADVIAGNLQSLLGYASEQTRLQRNLAGDVKDIKLLLSIPNRSRFGTYAGG